MLRLGRVSAYKLEAIARRAAGWAPTYDDIGSTLGGLQPLGFRHHRYEIELPRIPGAFALGVKALRTWVAHTDAGVTVAPTSPPARGATVAVAAAIGPLTAVGPCRIVEVIDEPQRYGFAYGTLPGHPERGEEAFLIERRADRVFFKIVAFSEPAELLVRLSGPVGRTLQDATTRRYLRCLYDFVACARNLP